MFPRIEHAEPTFVGELFIVWSFFGLILSPRDIVKASLSTLSTSPPAMNKDLHQVAQTPICFRASAKEF